MLRFRNRAAATVLAPIQQSTTPPACLGQHLEPVARHERKRRSETKVIRDRLGGSSSIAELSDRAAGKSQSGGASKSRTHAFRGEGWCTPRTTAAKCPHQCRLLYSYLRSAMVRQFQTRLRHPYSVRSLFHSLFEGKTAYRRGVCCRAPAQRTGASATHPEVSRRERTDAVPSG